MSVHRSRATQGAAMFAALLVFLLAAFPAMAAPRTEAHGQLQLTDHIDPADCVDVSLGAGGEILVGGVALTAPQLALLDADTLAALEFAAAAAASADAEVCVAITFGEGVVAVNAHADVCSVDIEIGAGGEVLVGGVEIDAGLFGSDLVSLLEAAAAADAEACAGVVVDENDVFADAVITACVTATLNEDGSVTFVLGGSEFEVEDGVVVDAEGQLELGVAVDVGIEIFGGADLTAEEFFLEAEIIVLDACGEGEPSASVDASASAPGGGGSAAPTTDGSVGGLPGANLTLPPTDGTVASGQGTTQLLLPIALLLLVSGGLLLHGRRYLAR